ncbi:MAG: translation elongation factor Ts [Rickettsiales bacterium TMED289]|nr:translation elongation factor Ts [Gammaproteobacteria bacterium]RPF74723.1 MAG: translation elongation factor Ts [Rickettsiales bacterium TMED289]|tara:strand:+ start:182 stop:970 length:789 start_codon:yes stop_codon:yes gene_type:complete
MITAQLVKELRDRTGISMMDCKSALVEAAGDIDKAIEVLRKKSIIKAEKKSSRATNEGVIVLGKTNDGDFIIEVNTETDFAAKDADFKLFLSDLSDFCSDKNPKDLNELEELYKNQLLEIIQKIGENIKISYFEKISSDGAFIYSYLHTDKKLAALVKLDKDQPELGRDIAMQVSANSPLAILAENIDQNILDKEKEIAIATLEGENKPDDIKEKIVMGKLNKFKQENSLVEQPFIKDPDQKIKDILNGATILAFARKKVGQ